MDKKTVSEPSPEPDENGTNNRSAEERDADLAYWHDKVRDYWTDLSAYARKITDRNIGRAERILQDVCLKLEKHPPRRAEIREAKAYLLRSLKNANSDARPKHSHVSLDDPDAGVEVKHLSVDAKVHETLENQQLLDFFGEGMATFDHRVFELWRQGHSTIEIADQLRKSIAAIHAAKRRILYQARRKREQLEPPETSEPKGRHVGL